MRRSAVENFFGSEKSQLTGFVPQTILGESLKNLVADVDFTGAACYQPIFILSGPAALAKSYLEEFTSLVGGLVFCYRSRYNLNQRYTVDHGLLTVVSDGDGF